jgi:CheY-like chemotaxis protein
MGIPFAYSENNKKIKILVVDDDKDVAITLKAILEETDDNEEKQDNNNKSKEFEVDLFNDPEVALSNFKSGHYDLLLLDIVMPKMNGFELYEELKI